MYSAVTYKRAASLVHLVRGVDSATRMYSALRVAAGEASVFFLGGFWLTVELADGWTSPRAAGRATNGAITTQPVTKHVEQKVLTRDHVRCVLVRVQGIKLIDNSLLPWVF